MYVPKLNRHVFTLGGCSNGNHDQPCFNESSVDTATDNSAFTEDWDGYILVTQPINNCVLKVSADDNASFYLYAFPSHVANLPGRGPLGGGSYASAESQPIPRLEPGYYRAHVSYTNIAYVGTNVARLDVQLNGSQIQLGQLETHNLLTSQKAREVYGFYSLVDYKVESVDVWAMFDKTDINTKSPNDGDNGDGSTGCEERKAIMAATEKETSTVAEVMALENSCATRVSIALSRSGFPIKKGPSASNVHLLTSDIQGLSGKKVKWHNACLRPDGIHNETDKSNYSHFIPSADNMGTFITNELGEPDYKGLTQYQAEYNVGGFSPSDIIIFYNPYEGERGWAHVGIGHSPDYGEGAIQDIEETHIWIVQRSSWGEPASN